jgi:hypothetical protein
MYPLLHPLLELVRFKDLIGVIATFSILRILAEDPR